MLTAKEFRRGQPIPWRWSCRRGGRGCEPPAMDARNWTQIFSAKVVWAINPWTISPHPPLKVTYYCFVCTWYLDMIGAHIPCYMEVRVCIVCPLPSCDLGRGTSSCVPSWWCYWSYSLCFDNMFNTCQIQGTRIYPHFLSHFSLYFMRWVFQP